MKRIWTAVAVLIAVGMLIAGCPSAPGTKNKKPIASFSPDKTVIFLGDSVTFNASASKDPDGKVKSYNWILWDGERINDRTENTITRQPIQGGLCNMTLTVKDNKGAVSSPVTTVVVVAPLPRTIPTSVSTYETVEFGIDFYPPFSEVRDRLSDIEWSFGDGTPVAKGQNVTHKYTENGSYAPSVKLTSSGKSVSMALVTWPGGKNSIDVQNQVPLANITVVSAPVYYANVPISFRGNASSDIDGQVVKWSWEFGDGTTSDSTNPSHAFRTEGSYHVNLTVTDNDNATSTPRFVFISVSKDLVLKDITAVTWQDNASGGVWRANLTIKFDSEGDAKPAGSVNLTVQAFSGYTQKPLEPVEDFTENGTYDAAIPGGSKKDHQMTINGLRIYDAEPEATAIRVEIYYMGLLADTKWLEL